MKIAIVFPGQGSQFIGMGKELYDSFDEVKEIYGQASEALGYDVADMSFNGPKDELNKTVKTQPCLLTASYAVYKVLTSKGIKPFCVAGHSLGEFTAVTAAGAISFSDAVKLTEKRGQFMQEAVPEGKGLMAAILGLEKEEMIQICESVRSGYVAPANYNCPGQIVISGETKAVEEAIALATEAGAKRAIPLAVSVPSHCALMTDSSNRLLKLLDNIDLQAPEIPVVNNADAAFLYNAADIKKSLIKQLNNPLLWEDTIHNIAANGVDTVIEAGPRKVLTGLIKRIDSGLKTFNVEDPESLEDTLKALI